MIVVSRLYRDRPVHTICSDLEAFLADVEERRGLSVNTIRSYHCDLRARAAAPTARLDEIMAADQASLLARREMLGTTNRCIASLGRFFIIVCI
jgi:integrase/recombinase XerD